LSWPGAGAPLGQEVVQASGMPPTQRRQDVLPGIQAYESSMLQQRGG
jgi:hypothetical protein